ncbi:MAG: hypothetical protein EOO01_03325 [Chitinophagaceae bacterium]|nr:MAG: hypothetical protein EOO01_03325 [Chitinophagaceae bacterium]
MYTHVWNKYLPIIRILLKKSAKEAQSLSFNVSDFEKIGPQKKTGFNFSLEFNKGRVSNMAGLSGPAKELLAVLTQDTVVKQLLHVGEYHLTMNAKFVLGIQQLNSFAEETQLSVEMEAVA